MTTTRTATAEKLKHAVGTSREKAVDASKEKEKGTLRRALGRGLESLLPGPRVVAPAQTPVAAPSAAPPLANSAKDGALGSAASAVDASGAGGVTVGTPVGSNDAAVGKGVPHFVRDDNSKVHSGAGDLAAGAVAWDQSSPFEHQSAIGGATENFAELRSAGQPGAAVPTSFPTPVVPISDIPTSETIAIHAQAESRTPGNLVSNIPLDHIDKNPYQTRYLFDEDLLEELADSIRTNGVVQPVVVRPAEEEGRYVLILGERRCRASRMAGKATVPAIVRRVSPQQAAEMTVVENLQRQDLNCLEQAEAFRLLSKEFNLTQEEIGHRVGMSRESVSNYMRLLRLPEEVMEYLAHGQIGFSEARELLSLDDATKIPVLADEIVKKHMSVEQIEMMVSRMNGWLDPVPGMPGEEKKKGGSRWVDPNVRAAQLEMERILGVRVRIRDRKGKGKIVIEYATVDDYERVVGMLRGKN